MPSYDLLCSCERLLNGGHLVRRAADCAIHGDHQLIPGTVVPRYPLSLRRIPRGVALMAYQRELALRWPRVTSSSL